MIVSTPPLVVVLVLVQELYIRQRRQKPIEVTGVADLSSHAVVLETDGSFSVLSATRGTDSCLLTDLSGRDLEESATEPKLKKNRLTAK